MAQMTLSRFLIEEQRDKNVISHDLRLLIEVVSRACKAISIAIGKGSLADPCQVGTLVCNGNQGWKCQGGKTPSGEVCDGVDNDCDGSVDDNVSGVGQPCGNTTPPCAPGVTACVNGTIDCQGGVKPQPETCNAKDDDCNGTVDDGLGLGGPCNATYDTTLYPGDRTKGECKPGVSQCDPAGSGNTTCSAAPA